MNIINIVIKSKFGDINIYIYKYPKFEKLYILENIPKILMIGNYLIRLYIIYSVVFKSFFLCIMLWQYKELIK